ncbi:DUF805 domain-containing protein [Sphingobium sp.]|uniref:DUF805 domain-containing protein n=1 Tax=Sphingobium sp. TaxID=1912891 RepID=UPI002632F77B|nr:DUF805 domain-containing protein [Sphingobium sp.]
MTALDWMILPLRRYARFNGRARPREYWMFVLLVVLALVALSILETALGLAVTEQWVRTGPWGASAIYRTHGGPLTGLFALGILIPHLAVMVRRLHDTDRSGWWLLLGLLPLLGGLVLLIFFIIGGTRGPNRFGPDPIEVGEDRL